MGPEGWMGEQKYALCDYQKDASVLEYLGVLKREGSFHLYIVDVYFFTNL